MYSYFGGMMPDETMARYTVTTRMVMMRGFPVAATRISSIFDSVFSARFSNQ